MRFLLAFAFFLTITGVVHAASLIVVDAQSGRVLESKAEDEPRQIASLTKIATAVIALEWAASQGVIAEEWKMKVPEAAMTDGANPLSLLKGDELSLDTALYAALMASDNRSALVIAESVGKALAPNAANGVSAFVDRMNDLAKRLGMTQTHFVNPHGLDAGERSGVSTAGDVAKLACFADRLENFHRYCREKTQVVTIFRRGKAIQVTLQNTNELVGSRGIDGMKTGTTRKAGACLVLSASGDPTFETQASRRLIVVLLGAEDRFREAVLLLNRTSPKL